MPNVQEVAPNAQILLPASRCHVFHLQAQSKEKTLAKMVRGGLTDKVQEEKALSFYFSDPGKLNGSILQFQVCAPRCVLRN